MSNAQRKPGEGPRQRQVGTGTPGAAGTAAARAAWSEGRRNFEALTDVDRRTLREKFATLVQVPSGMPEAARAAALHAAAETAARAYEEEWDRLRAEGALP